MADYYPLLARALDALPDRSPPMRKAVYERARNALIGQLRSLDPPLSEADIDLERRALDTAIARLEVDHGGIPAPANDVPAPIVSTPSAHPSPATVSFPAEPPAARDLPQPDLPEPDPPEPPPSVEWPATPRDLPEASASLPPASPPSFLPIPDPAPEPREAAIAITPRKPRQPEPDGAAADAAPGTAPSPASEADDPAAPETAATETPAPTVNDADAVGGRQRPRIAVVPPRSGRSKLLRNAFVGIVLTLVIGLIAVAAFLLRDKPQALQAGGGETPDTQQSDAEAKFGDRVGGAGQPDRAAPRPDAAPRTPAPTRGDNAPAQPGLSVMQRAVLLQEGAGGESAAPTSSPGRVAWRLETLNGDQGQPLQTAVVATVTFPDPGLTLVMTIQRNLDATLPASHTVSLAFTETGPDAAARAVQDIGLLQAKDEETSRGAPVSGLPVRVRENLFLIGLSSLRQDVERNTDLLLRRNWFDLAVRYNSGKRAVIVFEKGAVGAQVMQSAFDAWQ